MGGVSYLLDDLTNGPDAFLNDGTIVINGGSAPTGQYAYAYFTGPVAGSGAIDVTDGGVYVEPASPTAFSSDETIVFEDGKGLVTLGSGELASGLFEAQMENFQVGDTIDLGALATTVSSNDVGVVSLFEGVSLVGTLNLARISHTDE